MDCPLHLGITEAGALRTGTVKSSIGIGNLLWAGIGDTIRVSLAAEPEEEIKVGFDILKSLGLRHRGVNIIACPSCARQGFDVIKHGGEAGGAAGPPLHARSRSPSSAAWSTGRARP